VKKSRVITGLAIFSLSFFLLGYFRSYVFLYLNARASLIYYHEPYTALPPVLSMFESFDYGKLLTSKWLLTFLFTFLFGTLAVLSIFFAFRQKKYTILTIVVYALIFMVSLLSIMVGRFYPPLYSHCFEISRGLEHFQQSPMIAIILLLSIYYFRQMPVKEQ
jgi:hypothetical protein